MALPTQPSPPARAPTAFRQQAAPPMAYGMESWTYVADPEDSLSWLQKEVPTVLVCASGSRSAQALEILKNNGFEKIYNGGSWNSLGDIKAGGCPVTH